MHSSLYFGCIQCVTTDFVWKLFFYLMHFGRNGGQAVSLFNDFRGNEARNKFFVKLILDEMQFL